MGIRSKQHIKFPQPFFFGAHFRFHPSECQEMGLVLDPLISKQLADWLPNRAFSLLLKFLLQHSFFRKVGELFSAVDS
jgi:hypothetical protein